MLLNLATLRLHAEWGILGVEVNTSQSYED